MTHAINLLELNEASNQLLAKLFAENPEKNDWLAGIYFVDSQEITISHRIIKHLNSTSKKHVYEVLDHEPFGQGCFGSLYLSKVTLVPNEHQQNELIVKIKPEEKQRLIKIQDLKYFSKESAAREADNLCKIGFFHCKPLSFSPTQSFITMRKLPGEPLVKLIEANQLTIMERYQLSKALVMALKEQVHDYGLIHRDVKPQNILVTNQFVIHFIDFALAMLKNYDDRSDPLRGSIPYAAPEGFSPYQCTTVKSDIYALGRVLMMLWGDDFYNNPDFYFTDVLHSAKNVSFASLFNSMDEIPACYKEIRSLLSSMVQADQFDRPYFTEIMDILNSLSDKLQPIPNPNNTKPSNTISNHNNTADISTVKDTTATCYEDNFRQDDADEGYNAYYGF